MSILIKNCVVNGKKQNIYIEGNRISKIGDVNTEAEQIIDGKNKIALPSFFNGHTHSAMTLFRGFGDDMPLQQWLEQKIWPNEAKLIEEDVYIGAKLACLEMIKTGTTFFNDMYWHLNGTRKAVEESGMRAELNAVFIDMFSLEKANEQIELNKKIIEESKNFPSTIKLSMGPHAIYTVSKESLLWAKETADKNGLRIHIHLSETEKEVLDCIRMHGKRPVEYLDELGMLGPNMIACHAVWLDDEEIKLLAKNNVTVVHNPISNMKLAVGRAFPYLKLKRAGVNICLGTDGCASNNNLDMMETMKFAALLQKFSMNEPTVMPSDEAFEMATANGAKAFGIDAGLAEGKIADLILVDIKNSQMIPGHDAISNIVYSANGSCVDTTICDGKVLMLNRKVEWEDEILALASQRAREIVNR